MSFDSHDFRVRYTYTSALDERSKPDSTINKADHDEPVFVLRGRDVVAARAIRWWIWCAQNRGVPQEKLQSAHAQAEAFEAWLDKGVPNPRADSRQPARTAQQERTQEDSVLNRAKDNEPVFVIVASDMVAVEVIEFWAFLASENGAADAKIEASLGVARAMLAWRKDHGVAPRVPGVTPRAGRPVVAQEKGRVGDVERPKPATHFVINCRSCGHQETIGEPPYTEELMAGIREQLNDPCPACGATEWVNDKEKQSFKALQLLQVAPAALQDAG